MSREPVIRVSNVSKTYPEHGSSALLRQEGMKLIRRGVRGLIQTETPDSHVRGFQALKNISFEVYAGESVALVGRNGSGKTTLIRLLANIMSPTTGTIEVRGRYTALIGLGTGFIPEMTGRENIYLNAAIYGVPPDETDKLLEQIIEFADIGEFIERPVREYSSGMRARLGFSVASHIMPDIIMVDEALAVGDTAFRQKCYARIDELLTDDRTLVLVSHSEKEVRSLCERTIWLHNGEIQLEGDTPTVLEQYNTFMKVK